MILELLMAGFPRLLRSPTSTIAARRNRRNAGTAQPRRRPFQDSGRSRVDKALTDREIRPPLLASGIAYTSVIHILRTTSGKRARMRQSALSPIKARSAGRTMTIDLCLELLAMLLRVVLHLVTTLASWLGGNAWVILLNSLSPLIASFVGAGLAFLVAYRIYRWEQAERLAAAKGNLARSFYNVYLELRDNKNTLLKMRTYLLTDARLVHDDWDVLLGMATSLSNASYYALIGSPSYYLLPRDVVQDIYICYTECMAVADQLAFSRNVTVGRGADTVGRRFIAFSEYLRNMVERLAGNEVGGGRRSGGLVRELQQTMEQLYEDCG